MSEMKTINRQIVKTLALDSGFDLKEGSELRPYVYAFAWALEKEVLNNAQKQRNAEAGRHLGLIDSVVEVIEKKVRESGEEAENALAEGNLGLSNALKAQAWTLSVVAGQVREIESRAQRQSACEAMRFHDWYIKFDPRGNSYHRNTAQSAWNEALGVPQMTQSHIRLTPMESASCSIEWHKREFEVWANSKDLDVSVHTLNDNGGIVYDSDFTDLAWQSWLASKGVKEWA